MLFSKLITDRNVWIGDIYIISVSPSISPQRRTTRLSSPIPWGARMRKLPRGWCCSGRPRTACSAPSRRGSTRPWCSRFPKRKSERRSGCWTPWSRQKRGHKLKFKVNRPNITKNNVLSLMCQVKYQQEKRHVINGPKHANHIATQLNKDVIWQHW